MPKHALIPGAGAGVAHKSVLAQAFKASSKRILALPTRRPSIDCRTELTLLDSYHCSRYNTQDPDVSPRPCSMPSWHGARELLTR